jgi:hypothetical protein
MRGVRFVRNSVHHQWSDALQLHQGAVVPPLRPPIVFFEWCWRAAGDLPKAGRKDKAGEAVYRELLECRPARHTLEAPVDTLSARNRAKPSSCSPYSMWL